MACHSNVNVTAHVQTDDVCIHLMTGLQTCESLVTFANVTYNVCKRSHHYANMSMYLVDCCGGLMEE
jgi:hypothetical protein